MKKTTKHRTSSDSFDQHLAARMRELRKQSGLRLGDVAKRANCSESSVSKIERGQMSPTVNMLHRLANAYEVNISELLKPPNDVTGFVIRRKQHAVISSSDMQHGDGITLESLLPLGYDGILQAFLHTISAGGASDGMIQHDGEELGMVLEGTIGMTVGDRHETLNAGDTFFFPSDLPHGYCNEGDVEARVIWVNTPPTY